MAKPSPAELARIESERALQKQKEQYQKWVEEAPKIAKKDLKGFYERCLYSIKVAVRSGRKEISIAVKKDVGEYYPIMWERYSVNDKGSPVKIYITTLSAMTKSLLEDDGYKVNESKREDDWGNGREIATTLIISW